MLSRKVFVFKSASSDVSDFIKKIQVLDGWGGNSRPPTTQNVCKFNFL